MKHLWVIQVTLSRPFLYSEVNSTVRKGPFSRKMHFSSILFISYSPQLNDKTFLYLINQIFSILVIVIITGKGGSRGVHLSIDFTTFLLLVNNLQQKFKQNLHLQTNPKIYNPWFDKILFNILKIREMTLNKIFCFNCHILIYKSTIFKPFQSTTYKFLRRKTYQYRIKLLSTFNPPPSQCMFSR